MDCEAHNHRQIEQLNQRGGRTLSVVDLIRAGTLDVELAGYAMRAMAGGASLLTGARPGGAGKTTLMAALLALLPPEVPIVTVDDSAVIGAGRGRSADEPACYLAHEIGSGSWYGYIWGRDVADFFSLVEGRRRIASCLHADTLEETAAILAGPPLRVARETLGRVGLVLFIHVLPGPRGPRRRVAACWESDGRAGHRRVFRYDPQSDGFVRDEPPRPASEELPPYGQFIRGLVDDAVVETPAVRRRVVEFYRREK